MAKYNNKLTAGIFRDESLKDIIPYLPKELPLQNIYSNAEIKRRVKEYLIGALPGTADADILVEGNPYKVLEKVKELKPIMEQFFNSIPSIVKNIRRNTKIYSQMSSVAKLKQTKSIDKKTQLMQDIVDNINYNPEWGSENRLSKLPQYEFAKKQMEWASKVGYTGLGKQRLNLYLER